MAFLLWLAALAFGPQRVESTPGAPYYTAASIANSAANVAGFYTPNSFISIYGQNLSYVTKPIGVGDIGAGGILPWSLTGTNVGVLINLIPADVYFVSPNQVNVLIPPSLIPGPAIVELQNDGLYGPAIQIALVSAAPVLFQSDATTAIATHGNGPLVTAAAPAQPGEVVVLYATGLGPTAPASLPNQIPQFAASIVDLADFRLLLNGSAVDPRLVFYAGVTPGYAGLFQINLRLPDNCPPNPEIRVGFGDQLSPAGLFLPIQ
jgi:uncharacterized protein (TIGR03437 family)